MAFYFNQNDRPLDGYTVQRGVGHGGFGEVYHALSDAGKEVALKYLRDNPQIELRGVTACLNLKSPHLVTLYDIRQNQNGDWFVIMEYVDGPSLRDLLAASPRGLGVQKASYLFREIAKGLIYLHDRGIVHRDMKPGNIFYEDGAVKIGDYGLSKSISTSQHSGQTIAVGSVHYMAPEIGSGNYARSVDIYGLGVILYEMLIGRVPFQGASTGEVLMKHLTAQPEVDELPAPFPDVIRKALAKDPMDRYQTVNEMLAAVFVREDLERSVAAFEPMSLTQIADRIPKAAMAGAATRGAGTSWGSSQFQRPSGPPPVVDGGRAGSHYRDRAPLEDRVQNVVDRILPNSRTPFPQRDRRTAGLLGIFAGFLGAHRFYLGFPLIGFLQILATSTGVGALWGIIDGIIVMLDPNATDAFGRTLRDDRGIYRSMVARVMWGAFAVLTFIGGIIAAVGGFVASPGYETIRFPVDAHLNMNSYSVNPAHSLFGLSALLVSVSLFSVWKSAHRAGLPTWRATLRPLALCITAVACACGAIFYLTFAAGVLQMVALIFSGLSAVAFGLLWILRGPPITPAHDDIYWQRAWSHVFIVMGIISLAGFLLTMRKMQERHTESWLDNDTPLVSSEVTEWEYGYRDTDGRRVYGSYPRQRTLVLPTLMYSPLPFMLDLFAVVGFCSFNEARHRRRLSYKAAGATAAA